MKPYYQDDAVTIYHGDCREILPTLEKVDLVLTDPPYGIGADKAQQGAAQQRIKAAGSSKAGRGYKDYGATNWDSSRPAVDVFNRMLDICTDAIIWGGNYFADALPASMGWLVWNKCQRGFSLADGELAWTSFQNAMRIFDISRGAALQDGKEHPTQKSLEVMRLSIGYADRHAKTNPQTILDPFMGSGTTLRAAKDLGRKAIGIELEERYCEIAARRMCQEVLL